MLTLSDEFGLHLEFPEHFLTFVSLHSKQDFVRLPWQNQSGQSAAGTHADTSIVSNNSTFSNAYGLPLGQLNKASASSSLEITGSPPIDLSHDELDSSSFNLLRYVI